MPERRNAPRRTIRVLLVDDSPAYMDALSACITEFADVEIVGCAGSGEAALAALASLSVDLVLMDLYMPGIGGIEATRRIKALGKRPAVAVLTLDPGARNRERALAAGADYFLRKEGFMMEFPAVLASLHDDDPI